MKGYRRWLFPSVLMLVFSAAAVETAQSQRLENREANREGWIDQEMKSAGATLTEEQRLKDKGSGTTTDEVEKQGRQKTNKAGNRMGEKMERQRSEGLAAPGALNNDSVPSDPNERGD